MRGLLVLTGLCFLLLSCHPSRMSTRDKKEYIEFEKTACLGNCKAYRIIISRTGKAWYKGIMNTAKSGDHFRKLGKTENDSLWQLIDSASLPEMKEEYDYGAEDSQQRFIRYYKNGNKKEVRFGHNVPEILKNIETIADEISERGRWLGM